MQRTDEILERANRMQREGQSCVLATVVRAESPTSAKPGAKALVSANGEITGWIGGGCAQPAVIDTAKQVLADGQARLIRVSPKKGEPVEPGIIDFGMTCHSGGTLDIFLEAILAKPELVIIGGSPVAQSLCAQARHAGFSVHATCPGADRTMFPEADEVLDHLDLSALTCKAPRLVVVATQGKRDEAGLIAALETGAPYIAFVASERKAAKLKSGLIERGHPADQVDAIRSPAGIEIGAVTPEEIAVSVLAGVIRAHRSGISVEKKTLPEAVEPGIAQRDGDAVEPPAASCCAETANDPAPTAAVAVSSCCGGESSPKQSHSGTDAA